MLGSENLALRSKVQDQDAVVKLMQEDLKKLSPNDTASRLDYLEDQSRRNNLRVDGLPEDECENWEKTSRKVTLLVKDKLGIPGTISIERAHRVGRQQADRPRTIVARFWNYTDKENI